MSASDSRLRRLRDLVAQLERLPSTPERDRLLADVRGRAVDVDTGEEPQPLRKAEPIPALLEDVAAPVRARKPAGPPPFAPAPQARPVPVPEPAPAPDDEDDPGWTTDVLWLDDAPGPSGTDPEDDPPRPWTLGLRG